MTLNRTNGTFRANKIKGHIFVVVNLSKCLTYKDEFHNVQNNEEFSLLIEKSMPHIYILNFLAHNSHILSKLSQKVKWGVALL